ncbi:tRNA threonylcarbamoyladenosine dehydratase [Paratissierella segnis]|jgi:tRNA A37 threonylcarbamoyladenosine dehydratase|uniref:tRNA threonylcarbamoyladenosine dehydratase n=1 Tax=Paratissierella segnis TaxID=2763679 RepID=A0A926EY65_9FIRM|nr:tRNA threonylcarbamoyladenosine dehydratase [Paratissierella segnis]MBC8588667.1 tRNA threonylcarbamoyladenosine dehydratase [Paratissierella segnis]
MKNPFERTELLLGIEEMKKLQNSEVAVFGIGGVGSFSAEALVRSGLGKIVLVDYDIIDITNINRQIHATIKTVGLSKVEVMKERLLDINPDLEIKVFNEKYTEETKDLLLSSDYDYVIDAIDMISAKIDLINTCKTMGISIISSMGAGNKLDPTSFEIKDIYSTKVCPLAKVMRRELKKRGIKDLKVVCSEETPKKINIGDKEIRKATPGSIAFVPSVVGLILASEVIKDLIK